MVEQPAVNRLVIGSSPVGGAKDRQSVLFACQIAAMRLKKVKAAGRLRPFLSLFLFLLAAALPGTAEYGAD